MGFLKNRDTQIIQILLAPILNRYNTAITASTSGISLVSAYGYNVSGRRKISGERQTQSLKTQDTFDLVVVFTDHLLTFIVRSQSGITMPHLAYTMRQRRYVVTRSNVYSSEAWTH